MVTVINPVELCLARCRLLTLMFLDEVVVIHLQFLCCGDDNIMLLLVYSNLCNALSLLVIW